MSVEKKKMGRKPLKGEPMTGVERNKRLKAKNICYLKAAQNSGFTPRMILINDEQFKAIGKLEEGFGGAFNRDRLNEWVFVALRDFLKAEITAGLLDLEAESLPDNSNALSMVQIEAAIKFLEWETSQKQQQNEGN